MKYTCAYCGETYVSDWSDDEARAELATLFPTAENCAVVCDDCYKSLTGGSHEES